MIFWKQRRTGQTRVDKPQRKDYDYDPDFLNDLRDYTEALEDIVNTQSYLAVGVNIGGWGRGDSAATAVLSLLRFNSGDIKWGSETEINLRIYKFDGYASAYHTGSEECTQIACLDLPIEQAKRFLKAYDSVVDLCFEAYDPLNTDEK